MTNTPPDPQLSPKTPLGFDEFISIFIALVTIGTILFWAFGKKEQGVNLGNLLSPLPAASPQSTLQSPLSPAPALLAPETQR